MGQKRKPIPTYSTAVKKLTDEVSSNTCRVYDVSSIPSDFPHRPSDSKVTHYSVAVSGEPTSNVEYMLVIPHRVDTATNHDKTQTLVYDLDPAILILDSETKEVSPSGLTLFHQNFDGRTSPVGSEMVFEDYSKSVAELKSLIVTGETPLQEAPDPVLNALHHAVTVLKSHTDWLTPSAQTEEGPTSPGSQGSQS